MWKSTSGPRRWRGGALELRFDFRAAGVRVFRPIRAVRRYGQVLQHVGQHELELLREGLVRVLGEQPRESPPVLVAVDRLLERGDALVELRDLVDAELGQRGLRRHGRHLDQPRDRLQKRDKVEQLELEHRVVEEARPRHDVRLDGLRQRRLGGAHTGQFRELQPPIHVERRPPGVHGDRAHDAVDLLPEPLVPRERVAARLRVQALPPIVVGVVARVRRQRGQPRGKVLRRAFGGRRAVVSGRAVLLLQAVGGAQQPHDRLDELEAPVHIDQ